MPVFRLAVLAAFSAIIASAQSTPIVEFFEAKVRPVFDKNCSACHNPKAQRGVRFIQCSHSYKWDQHTELFRLHTRNAREVDVPIAGLLKDLKARGMMNDTLVLWGAEFGRTPVAQEGDGRDHNPYGYSMWMAGGGVKGGITYGATDEFGYYAVEDRMHLHDLHATILHLMGLEHTKLTYFFSGRNFRLTDVAGNVATKILA
jgi:uncharacterized protein (DUF1501 family)